MTASGQPDHDPAAALGEVWEALDALPRSATPPSATATTIEMVAVSAQHRAVLAARPTPLAWLGAAALVIGGFVGGFMAGRATLPVPDVRFPHGFPPPSRDFPRPHDRARPVPRPLNEREPEFRRGPSHPAETPQPPR
jgi:hypothetical protein